MKPKPYSRRVLRSLSWERAQRNKCAVAGLVAVCFGLMVAGVALVALTRPESRFYWYLVGISHAAFLAALAWSWTTGTLANEQSAIRHLRGAWGEEFTRDELKRAKRRRSIWGWADSLDLQVGDVDHLVVSRGGGLLAIDSKWRNETSSRDLAEMARSAQRVRLRVQGIVQGIVGAGWGRHRDGGRHVPVRAVVVIWGAQQNVVPAGHVIDDVHFVAGRDLVRWLSSLEGEPIERDAAGLVLEGVERFRDSVRERQVARA